jgi:hypothetical protein
MSRRAYTDTCARAPLASGKMRRRARWDQRRGLSVRVRDVAGWRALWSFKSGARVPSRCPAADRERPSAVADGATERDARCNALAKRVRIRLWKSIAPNRRPMAIRVRRFDPGLPRPGPALVDPALGGGLRPFSEAWPSEAMT